MNHRINDSHIMNDDCETLHDLLPAYSMGITDPDETALVERLLPQCPELQAELDDYEHIAGTMPFTVPQIAPPPALGTRILQAAAEEVKPVTIASPRVIHLPRRMAYAAAGIAAAIMLLLLGVIAVLNSQIGDLRGENSALLAQITTRDNLLALAGEDMLARFPLGAVGDNVLASATVVCNRNSNTGVLRVDGFAESAPGTVYQAWLINGDERTSAGTFEVGPDGMATLVFSAPFLLGDIEYVGITPEPAGGSPGPTADPIVLGALWPRNEESQS